MKMISKFAQAVINISAAVTYTVRSAILGLGLSHENGNRFDFFSRFGAIM